MNNNPVRKKTVRHMLQQFSIARTNLLLMTVLTIVNILFHFTGSDVMLLFSATIPYFSVIFGKTYVDALLIPEFAVIGLVIAAVVIVFYLLCWIFSKKHYGWMIAALVLFALDTVAIILFHILIADTTGFLDVLIHIWVLYYLIIGVINGWKLNNMPQEVALTEQEAPQQGEANEETNSTPLHIADNTVKSRVFLEGDYIGHHITYRRVKRVNELVIDGYVYDEIEMLLENSHQLIALVNGHTISAGLNGTQSYIAVDGNVMAKKARLF